MNETVTNRGKKKEVLLDDVTGSAASRAPAALANTLLGGAKGRRSERDQNKYGSARNSVAKAGRPAMGCFRGERKTKTKPKQRTAQLSTSGNGLVGRVTKTTHFVHPSGCDSIEKGANPKAKVSRDGGFISLGNTYEYGCSILGCSFADDSNMYYCVGTAYVLPKENEPSKEGLHVLAKYRRQLLVHAEVQLDAGSLSEADGAADAQSYSNVS